MASSTASPSSPAFTYPDESDPLSYIIENGFSDGTWGESLALWFATTLTSDSGLVSLLSPVLS
jgi:hypothetical protein